MTLLKYCLAVTFAAVVAVGCQGTYTPPQQTESLKPQESVPGATAEAPAPEAAPETPPAKPRPVATKPQAQPAGGGAPTERRAPAPAREERPVDVPRPAPPPEPEIIEVTIPEGTVLELELLTGLDSAVTRVGDEIQARTLSAVYVKGKSVISKGAYVEGRVTEAQASGRVKGKASLGFTFDRISTKSGTVKMRTSYVAKEAASGKKKDATVIGGGAGIGAVVGGIIGGKKGAAIGAAVGGGAGTGVVLATKGEEIRLPAGTEVNVRLDEPVTVVVK